jgi:hypothetical protein
MELLPTQSASRNGPKNLRTVGILLPTRNSLCDYHPRLPLSKRGGVAKEAASKSGDRSYTFASADRVRTIQADKD